PLRILGGGTQCDDGAKIIGRLHNADRRCAAAGFGRENDDGRIESGPRGGGGEKPEAGEKQFHRVERLVLKTLPDRCRHAKLAFRDQGRRRELLAAKAPPRWPTETGSF